METVSVAITEQTHAMGKWAMAILILMIIIIIALIINTHCTKQIQANTLASIPVVNSFRNKKQHLRSNTQPGVYSPTSTSNSSNFINTWPTDNNIYSSNFINTWEVPLIPL